MGKCPECGGEMIGHMKRKICQTCGLSLTGSEYDRMWDRVRDGRHNGEDGQNKDHQDYLKWYTSNKKDDDE